MGCLVQTAEREGEQVKTMSLQEAIAELRIIVEMTEVCNSVNVASKRRKEALRIILKEMESK